MIPEDMQPALMGVIPATIITCSKDGIPNITNIARVWYVDTSHVAIANNMLKKSIRNLHENRFAFIRTMDPSSFQTWEMEAEYIGPCLEGGIFEEMKTQYEVLSMMMNSAMPIRVHSAEIFRVLSARICVEESSHLLAKDELYGSILEQLEKIFRLGFSAVWEVEEYTNELHLAAVRGLDENSETKVLKQVSRWAVHQEKPIRIFNIRSHYQYAITTFLQLEGKENFSSDDFKNLNQHYAAIPIIGKDGKVIAVIASQSNDLSKFSFFTEEIMHAASKHLSKLIAKLPELMDLNVRYQAIDQVLERIRLEGSKRKGDVNTSLSPRELQVAIQVAKGLSNEEIAKALFLSKRTVTTHLERIYQKLAINSRAALASYVLENGLMDST